MPSTLTATESSQDLLMRKMFADAIRCSGYKADAVTADVFYHTIRLAHERNWIHHTRLALAVEKSDSLTRKWFEAELEGKPIDDKRLMATAILKLSDLIRDDVARIEAGKPTKNNTDAGLHPHWSNS
jgi:hypothetical protein